MTAYLRTSATQPGPDDLCIVALYDTEDRRRGYALCFWRDGEWQSDEGDYSWSGVVAYKGRLVGLLWQFVSDAPENAMDIPAVRLARQTANIRRDDFITRMADTAREGW